MISSAALLLVGFLILAISTTTSPASAQDDGEKLTISNGYYVGSHLVEGIFFMEIEIPDSDETGIIGWEGRLEGPLEFESALGNLLGEWSISGEATIESEIGDFEFAGTQTTTAEGIVDGYITRPAFDSISPQDEFDSLNLIGAATISTEILSSSVLGPRRTVTEDTLQMGLEINEFIASCNQINGSWTWQIEQELTAAGLTPGLEANFYVVKSGPDQETQELMLEILRDLQREGTSILLDINNGNINRDQIIQWLDKANRAIASIEKDLDCGIALDKSQYLTPITHLTCEIARATQRNAPSTRDPSNPRIYPAFHSAVSMGCIGSGSFSPERQAEIRDQIDEAMGNSFNSLSAESKELAAKQFADAAQLTGSTNTKQTVESWLSEQSGGE
jgi:hypothetical protein